MNNPEKELSGFLAGQVARLEDLASSIPIKGKKLRKARNLVRSFERGGNVPRERYERASALLARVALERLSQL